MSLNEFGIIQQFFSDLTGRRADTLKGIGDDCAILQPRPDKLLVVSTDTLVAGRHFFTNAQPENIGYKSLAVNLSDLAAMGAEPAWVSLALTMPEADHAWLKDFVSGFGQLARCHSLELIGGDLTRGPLSITVTIHGYVSPGHVLQRQGANAGDLVAVSGNLGSAALALQQLMGLSAADSPEVDGDLLNALNRPEPRIQLGMQLAQFATSCIDISDGLISDLGHICHASGCQAEIELPRLPCHPVVSAQIQDTGCWDIPLTGGDDYELCFTLKPSDAGLLADISQETGVAITTVGKMKRGAGVVCMDEKHQVVQIASSGFMHF